jgi:hypothetical protein
VLQVTSGMTRAQLEELLEADWVLSSARECSRLPYGPMIYRGGTDLLQRKGFLAMNQKELTEVIQKRSRDHTQGITVLQAFKLVERKKAIDSRKQTKDLAFSLGKG